MRTRTDEDAALRRASADDEEAADQVAVEIRAVARRLGPEYAYEASRLEELADEGTLTPWADPTRHAMTVVTEKDSGGDVNLVALCACGWRAIPVMWLHQANRERCPVLEALQERKKRQRAHVAAIERQP